jgi:hypothetical protein
MPKESRSRASLNHYPVNASRRLSDGSLEADGVN